MGLYEAAVQVVPVLMIALFVDSRTATPVRERAARLQSRVYVLLSVVAFFVAILTVAEVLAPNQISAAVVLGALIGCIMLMGVQGWARFGRPSRTPQPPKA